MLILLKKIWIINGFLIALVVSISLLSVYWHHQMYLLHKKERIVKAQLEQIISIKKSQNILLMHIPSQIEELSL